jgi:hypothetical protein
LVSLWLEKKFEVIPSEDHDFLILVGNIFINYTLKKKIMITRLGVEFLSQ